MISKLEVEAQGEEGGEGKNLMDSHCTRLVISSGRSRLFGVTSIRISGIYGSRKCMTRGYYIRKGARTTMHIDGDESSNTILPSIRFLRCTCRTNTIHTYVRACIYFRDGACVECSPSQILQILRHRSSITSSLKEKEEKIETLYRIT